MTEFTEIDLQQEQKQPKASETDKFYAKGDGEVVKVFFSSLTPNQEVCYSLCDVDSFAFSCGIGGNCAG